MSKEKLKRQASIAKCQELYVLEILEFLVNSMGWTKIIETKKPSIKNIALIQGLPGLGLVGKIAVDYIISDLKLEKFATLYSNDLMLPDGKAGVIVNLYGVEELPRYEFFYYKGSKDIIFLAGNTQPVSWAQYDIAEKVIDYINKNFGLDMIISVCGTVSRGYQGEIFIAANSKDLLEDLSKKYNLKISSEGTITGACGLLPGLATLYNIEGISLMGTVSRIYPDPIAAKSLIKILDKMFGLNINYTKINMIIEDMKKKAEIAEKLRREVSGEIPEKEKERRQPWYYI